MRKGWGKKGKEDAFDEPLHDPLHHEEGEENVLLENGALVGEEKAEAEESEVEDYEERETSSGLDAVKSYLKEIRKSKTDEECVCDSIMFIGGSVFRRAITVREKSAGEIVSQVKFGKIF